MTENQAIVQAAGSISHALLQHLKPIISVHEGQILSKMKNLYREGNLDHMKLVACVAELCALEDMITTLNSRVSASKKYDKQNFEGGNI